MAGTNFALCFRPVIMGHAPDLWVNGSAPMFHEDFDMMIPPIFIEVPKFDGPTQGFDQPCGSDFLSAHTSAALPPPLQHHPTTEQTSDPAILLAHELSHHILSYHVETLSYDHFCPGHALSRLGFIGCNRTSFEPQPYLP